MNQNEVSHQVPRERIHICQGEYAIGCGTNTSITTLLGSCVSACIWEPNLKIGGMNHVVFTNGSDGASETFGHGVNGMELLINALLGQGATKQNLRAKVFGGARMFQNRSDLGAKNGQFVLDYLGTESIEVCGGDLGGARARQIDFSVSTGRVLQRYVNDVVEEPVIVQSRGSGLELL